MSIESSLKVLPRDLVRRLREDAVDDEPRNDKGEWTAGGGGSSSSSTAAPDTPGTPIGGSRDALLTKWFGPNQMEGEHTVNPNSGYSLKSGPWRAVSKPPEGAATGPAEFTVTNHGDGTLYDFQKTRTTEPINTVYRAMGVDEYNAAKAQGFIQSDQRGTIINTEGTNAAADPASAFSYLPYDGAGRIVQIQVNPADGWHTISADNYLRTSSQIPFDRVTAVSPVIGKDASGRETILREAAPTVDSAGSPKHLRFDAGTSADRINSQLWTGGAITTDQDVHKLAAAGITADIDNRKTHDDSSLVDSYSDLPHTPASLKTHPLLDYFWNGTADDGEYKSVSWFSDAWTFAKPILQRGGVIYTHCAAGHNRGPSIAYFLLRAYWGMPGDAALKLIQTRRPEATVAYRYDADRAIAQLGLDGPDAEAAELTPPPAPVADPVNGLKETARYYGLSSSEMRKLREAYNPDQPRSADGEWTAGDMNDAKAIVSSLNGATGEQASAMLRDGVVPDTRTLHTDASNNYDQASTGMHEAMIDHYMAGTTPQANPQAVYTAGGPASGKSGLAGQDTGNPERNLEIPAGSVYVNPDDIKERMGTYNALQSMGRSDIAASATHEESSDIAKALTATAIDGQRNMVVDGVGDSGVGKFGDKIRDSINNGYSTEVRYAYLPLGTAMQREAARADTTGRKVDSGYLVAAHAGVSRSYNDDVQHITDASIKIYSTDGVRSGLIAEKPAGSSIRVYDVGQYAGHVAKATG
jgi:hypothetical protein